MATPRERALEVSRTARFYEQGGDPGSVRELWYVLHGYAELARQVAERVAFLGTPERRVLVPEGLSRFYREGTTGEVGASWMTREAREAEIEDQVGYLDALHALARAEAGGVPRVTVIGFSQGAATAARWVAQGEVRPWRLVLWGGALPPDVDLEGGRDHFLALSYVVGTRDRFVSKARMAEERARVEAAGLPFRLRTFEGGHRLDEEVLRDLASEEP